MLTRNIFEGTDKSSNLFSVREFGYNCLLYSLDEVLRYSDVLNIIQTDEFNRVVERKETPLFERGGKMKLIITANKAIGAYKIVKKTIKP